ncbi:lipoVacJ domain protein [Burkholderia thailandensis]|nr:lipoVacJ domain protein [Burkholderia thailandensis]
MAAAAVGRVSRRGDDAMRPDGAIPAAVAPREDRRAATFSSARPYRRNRALSRKRHNRDYSVPSARNLA